MQDAKMFRAETETEKSSSEKSFVSKKENKTFNFEKMFRNGKKCLSQTKNVPCQKWKQNTIDHFQACVQSRVIMNACR